MGQTKTGITYQGTDALPLEKLHRDNYELKIRAKKIAGNDFFVGVTFPLADDSCSFIVGGWGGTVVGLSTIDGNDAARNATRTLHKIEVDRWYDIRVKVSPERIECWIDEEKVVDQVRAGHQFSIRPEVQLSRPLGMSTFQTATAVEKIQLVMDAAQ